MRNLFQCGLNKQGEDQKKGLQFNNFHKLWLSSQNSCDFSQILKQKKKGLRPKSFFEIRCESTKITKIRAVNTNLGVLSLGLHSNSPDPVNSRGTVLVWGAQFSFGGHKQSFGGARPWNAPPVTPGLDLQQSTTFRQAKIILCHFIFQSSKKQIKIKQRKKF